MLEFVAFAERLERSFCRYLVRAELALLSITEAALGNVKDSKTIRQKIVDACYELSLEELRGELHFKE